MTERWKIKTEFEKALDLYMRKRSARRHASSITLGFLEEPTKLITTVGDRLSKRDGEEYIVGRVKGLHDFWEDLAESSDNVRRQFNRLFPKQADESTWSLGKRLAEAVDGATPIISMQQGNSLNHCKAPAPWLELVTLTIRNFRRNCEDSQAAKVWLVATYSDKKGITVTSIFATAIKEKQR